LTKKVAGSHTIKEANMAKENTSKLHAVDGGIAPETVGNPDAADDLAIDQSHLEEYANPGSESAVVECVRPPKGIFFTVRAETGKLPYKDRAFYFLLQIEGRDPYLVAPKIAEQKSEEDTIRPVLIVRYVTMAGEEGLWPLKLNPPDGKSNNWNTSALNIIEIAETKWVRIVNTKKHYRHQPSKKTLKEVPPKFSDRSFKDLIDIAFKDRIVKSLDHEIWDILENGSDK
jgi:hypothetical protein